jgi:hypothetical protein
MIGLGLLIKEVVGGVTGFFKDKAAIKKATVEGQIRVIQSAADNVAQWEQLHAKGSQSSWKDEYWTIIWSIPLIMGFVPGLNKYAVLGFTNLALMPEWYQYTLMTMVLASFGIRVGTTVKSMIGR